MKFLSISIGVFGVAQATQWAWAPRVLRWQMRNALEHFHATDTLEVAMRVVDESMRYVYVESAIYGVLMLVASVLLLARRRAGWNLWLVCIGLADASALAALAMSGASLGAVLRLLLLVGFSYASFRAYKSGALAHWLLQKADLPLLAGDSR